MSERQSSGSPVGMVCFLAPVGLNLPCLGVFGSQPVRAGALPAWSWAVAGCGGLLPVGRGPLHSQL